MVLLIQAYKNMVKKTGAAQQMLPGLKYTPDQLFFIGTAQVEWMINLGVKKTLTCTSFPSSLGARLPRSADRLTSLKMFTLLLP